MTAPVKTQFMASIKLVMMSLALLLAIAACSSDNDDPDDSNPPLGSDSITFSVAADGTQEIPATGSTASATGTLTLDRTTGALTGSVTTTGLTTDVAHIHDGFAGMNGGVIITLDVDGATISVPDSTVLTADQQASMLAGAYYVNIHSAAIPTGEIRGQLAPTGIAVMQVALDGSSEVPPVSSAGSGTAYLTVNETTGAAVINVITTGLTTPTAAHLHGGFAGSNGGVLQELEQDAAEVGNFSTAAGTVLSAENLTSLLNGGTYINVHTAETPSGELRGQVLPSGITLLNAALSGDQEVPPVTTLASGNGVVTLNENDSTLTAFVNVADAPTANAGHIHEGTVGNNGGVVIILMQNTDDAGIFSASAEAVTAEQIETLKTGGMYFNIHTPENPGGEIRGQIEP
ncbi:MAG: CHRD domain-containing protein [Granulosicoccus sp.]|nr:CHRD domain-containing protein [Granulosicoccus sp.]